MRVQSLFATVAIPLIACMFANAGEPASWQERPCASAGDRSFEDEVWAKVGAQKCLVCHKVGGDAEKSEFVLRDPEQTLDDKSAALRHNREAFDRMAKRKEGDQYRLLMKAIGGLDHGGADVLPVDSTSYRILADYVRHANTAAAAPSANELVPDPSAPSFFDGVVMLEDARLLRRLTLSLAGRLPTTAELEAIQRDGLTGLSAILDGVMREEAFFDRLREGFNDIFLTVGIDGNADATVLSYEHFEKTRLWYQTYDLSHIADETKRTQAGYKLADDYRRALLGEPMKLIEYIVRHDRPFSEIVTADYIMVSPYTARGYGIFDEVKPQFKNPDNPFEYVPVKLRALVGRNKSEDQESKTGFYPHAGLLSTFQYLSRYPTTETNRNRLRARMYYQHFLGVDALELAARVSDAAAVSAKYDVPTMQASECVVCHRTIDPIAGVFQDYWRFADSFAIYGKRKEGWFKDMFAPGFEGEKLPDEERWRALQWLGERTAKDPRFATTMVEHVYYLLIGRKVMQPPQDLDAPHYAAKRRAYHQQRCVIEQIAARFVASNFNLKNVFKDWAISEFYRADGLTTAAADPGRRAELDDIGVVRMLSPEQLERKVGAVFGKKWGRLEGELAILYGGIDSQEVTERTTDPSGAMGAIQRSLANDVACRHTLRDFARPKDERLLFPGIEPEMVPGTSTETDAAIRQAIVHLHSLVLGRNDAADSSEVDRTFALLAGIVKDASEKKDLERVEIYHCRHDVADAPKDASYTIRAWRGVLTYLPRRPEFLYE